MPRYGRSSRTEKICRIYREGIANGEKSAELVRKLCEQFDVQRPAIWRTLRRYGEMAPKEKHRAEHKTAPARREVLPPVVSRDPCLRCGTRGDLPCSHRPASGTPPPQFVDPIDKRTKLTGQGLNFYRFDRDRNFARTRRT